jgi:hypothetical protein
MAFLARSSHDGSTGDRKGFSQPQPPPGGRLDQQVFGDQRTMQAPIFPGQAPTTFDRDGNSKPIDIDPSQAQHAFKGDTAFSTLPGRDHHKPAGDYTFRSNVKAKSDFPGKQAGGGGDRPPGSVDDAEAAAGEELPKTGYRRSADLFKAQRVVLEESFAGEYDAQKIKWWETVWWNYIKYIYTRDILIGKDRFGNRFTASWYYIRTRHEVRKCHRIDKKKQFQPYGALPTDDRLWESWLRGWRNDPPTIEECEAVRKRRSKNMGVHKMDDEEVEDACVRLLTSTKSGSAYMNELDEDQKYSNRVLMDTDQRQKEASVAADWDGTWTAGFIRGDQFYNEEEVENMRSTMSHMYRDREWQALEMKRQTRFRKAPNPIGRPDDDDMDSPFAKGQPLTHDIDRTDSHVPMHQGIADLTTPELEKLRAECDALEDERLALRKELGLSDVADFREGREAVDRGYDPFQPPPTSGRWKPQCWQESWGVGGGRPM